MKSAKLQLITSMSVFGTIGIFVHYIPLSSASVAFARAVLGFAFLLAITFATGKKPSGAAIRKNLLILITSGAAIGFNWILLFESYKHTTVSTATVCYYLAPLLLLLFSPLLGERLTAKKLLCVAVALIGLVFVSGVVDTGLPSFAEIQGVLLGVGAAILYASVMFLNKKLSPISAYDKTIVQLGSSAVVILPYLFLTEPLAFPALTGVQWILLLVVGIVHTGISYTMYFDSLKKLDTQTVAVFSYLDPVIAVLLSALLLKEHMSISNIIGTVLILGSALYSELSN